MCQSSVVKVARILAYKVGRSPTHSKHSTASHKINVSDITVGVLTNHFFYFGSDKRWKKIPLPADEVFADVQCEGLRIVFFYFPPCQLIEMVIVHVTFPL